MQSPSDFWVQPTNFPYHPQLTGYRLVVGIAVALCHCKRLLFVVDCVVRPFLRVGKKQKRLNTVSYWGFVAFFPQPFSHGEIFMYFIFHSHTHENKIVKNAVPSTHTNTPRCATCTHPHLHGRTHTASAVPKKGAFMHVLPLLTK